MSFRLREARGYGERDIPNQGWVKMIREGFLEEETSGGTYLINELEYLRNMQGLFFLGGGGSEGVLCGFWGLQGDSFS